MTRDRVRLWRLRFARRWKLLLGVSATTTALAAACQHFDWVGMRGSEDSAYDQGLVDMTKWTARPAPAKDVVILRIDDASLQAVAANDSMRQAFGSWPWTRNVWARVVEQLDADGARAVVFDAVMSEKGSSGATDEQFAETLAATKTPFYLGFAVIAGHVGRVLPHVDAVNVIDPPATPTPASDTFPSDDANATFPGDDAASAGPSDADVARALAFPVTTSGGLALAPLVDHEKDGDYPQHPIPPVDPLLATTRGFGLVVTEQDDDGKLRRTRFAYTDGANDYVTLPVAAVADLLRADHVALAPGVLTIGTHRIAINPDGDAGIDYRGPLEQTFSAYSVISVLDQWADAHATPPVTPKLAPSVFKDKVVVIGGYALGTADVKITPFDSTAVPGVVKNAATIQNLLDGTMIVDAPFWLSILVTLAVAFFSVSVVTIFRNNWLEILWPFALFYGFYLVTGLLLVHAHLHVLSAMPSWAASTASLFIGVSNHVWKDHHRERVRETFTKHLDQRHLEELIELERLPALGGEHRELTVLVTDVRHFNEISRHFANDPHGLVKRMNDYLGRVTKVLLHEGGCLSKYLGDKAIVLFGAPMPQKDHALRACRAALHVVREVEHLQSTVPQAERDHLSTRIAIHAGEMFVGNFGTEKLVDYGVVGDGMSAAAELVDVNSAWSTSIAISDRVRREAGDAIVVRELERRTLPGEPDEPVWELVGLKGAVPQAKQEVVSLYDLALKAMRGARVEEARAALKQALARDPQDGPSKTLLARLDALAGTSSRQGEGR